MLIIGTLIVTWIAHNWWKLLLLIVAVIAIHEYVLHKKAKEKADGESEKEPDEKEGTISDQTDSQL